MSDQLHRRPGVALTTYQLLALTALMRCPLRAYALRQDIAYLTRNHVSIPRSTVQRTLVSLCRAQYITPCIKDAYKYEVRRGILYELTALGRSRAERELMLYMSIVGQARRWAQQYDANQEYIKRRRYDKPLFLQQPAPE